MLESLEFWDYEDSQDSGGWRGDGILRGQEGGLESLARFWKVQLESLVSLWEGCIVLFSHAAADEVGKYHMYISVHI